MCNFLYKKRFEIIMNKPIMILNCNFMIILLTVGIGCGQENKESTVIPICDEIKDIVLEDGDTENVKLKAIFSNNTLLVELKELILKEDLHDGEFGSLSQNLHLNTGCGSFVYIFYDGSESVEYFFSFLHHQSNIVFLVKNINDQEVWTANFKTNIKPKNIKTMDNSKNQFTISKSSGYPIGTLNQTYQIRMSEIIKGGSWEIVPKLRYKTYEGVMEWRCKIDLSRNERCGCDPSLEIEAIKDIPDCWNYTRKIRLGFSFDIDTQEIIVEPFDMNFDERDLANLGKIKKDAIHKLKLTKIQ